MVCTTSVTPSLRRNTNFDQAEIRRGGRTRKLTVQRGEMNDGESREGGIERPGIENVAFDERAPVSIKNWPQQ